MDMNFPKPVQIINSRANDNAGTNDAGIKLVPSYYLRIVRDAARAATPNQIVQGRTSSHELDLDGDVEFKTESGRATCRCCGEKIAKGSTGLVFRYDFTGRGNYAATNCHIHDYDCSSKSTPIEVVVEVIRGDR